MVAEGLLYTGDVPWMQLNIVRKLSMQFEDENRLKLDSKWTRLQTGISEQYSGKKLF